MYDKIFIASIGLGLGYIYYLKKINKSYEYKTNIKILEINNILSEKDLDEQYIRDNERLNTNLDTNEIISRYPNLKVFFTQTVYNYLFHYYLVPSLIDKNHCLFDKSNMYNEKHIEFEKEIFREIRHFDIMIPEKEKVICSIITELLYKQSSNFLELKLIYKSSQELFNFEKYKNVFVI